jgi:hypothetical protein
VGMAAISPESAGEDGSVRRCVVMVRQPGLFSPMLGVKSSRVFMQSPQNFAT